MENYESLGTIGEGTYGVVLKCRHKTTGQIVAIKKFKESDDDEQVKKTALREIKVLKALKHENIVSLLEVFRAKGKLFLVFEFVEKTILEEIEKHPEGLEPGTIKRLMWQLVRALEFCHSHNIMHRDIKPENLLVSRNGVLKLCDFGFARPLAAPGAKYTEYVSTRWYRAPELLVGDVSYGKAVDVWSIGCMFAEITTGLPLFPGDSDIDQLYHIIKCLGHVTARQQELFRKNSLYVGVKLPASSKTETEPLRARFPQLDLVSLDFLHQTIQDEPLDRWTCAELLQHPFFESMGDIFEAELQDAIQRDLNDAAAIRKKRVRKPPSRGGGTGVCGTRDGSSSNVIIAGGGAGSGSLPSPTVSIKSTASHDDYANGNGNTYGNAVLEPTGKNANANGNAVLKPTFKPMVVPTHFQVSGVTKDKLSASPHVIISNVTGAGGTKKSTRAGGNSLPNTTGGTGGSSGNTVSGSGAGTYHLPTLHGAMSTSSSTCSTTSAIGGTGDTSSYSSTKRPLVPMIAENQSSSLGVSNGGTDTSSGTGTTTCALGTAVPAEHMAFIHQHASVRQSMTSHGYGGGGGRSTGGASNGLVYPYSFATAGGTGGGGGANGGGVPPKPPPSSYMQNPYLATQAPPSSHAHKRTPHVLKLNGGAAAGTRQHISKGAADASDDVYSPKRFSGGTANGTANALTSSKPQSKKAAASMSMALDLTPQGIYVPPRTSHSTIRGSEHTRSRREQDGGHLF